jgi:hypothetical protein
MRPDRLAPRPGRPVELRPGCGCLLRLVRARWQRVRVCGQRDCIGRESAAPASPGARVALERAAR